MRVHHGVDSFLPHAANEVVDLREVVVIVNAGLTLNTFPHDSESHKVHAPGDKIVDILVVYGVILVESAIGWNIWVHFVNSVNTVEEHGATVAINELSGFRVDGDPGVSEACETNSGQKLAGE